MTTLGKFLSAWKELLCLLLQSLQLSMIMVTIIKQIQAMRHIHGIILLLLAKTLKLPKVHIMAQLLLKAVAMHVVLFLFSIKQFRKENNTNFQHGMMVLSKNIMVENLKESMPIQAN